MECKLENVVHFKNGKKKPNSKGNIPIYGGNGILGYTDKYNAFNNSIIIGRVGAYCGCVYKCKNKCWVSDNAILGQVKENYDYMYVYYLMKTLNINDLHVGSGQPLMTQEILNNIIVNIPCYKEQVKIGKFLNKIDKKIELNNQINNNLHELAENMFKQIYENGIDCKLSDLVSNISTGSRPKGGAEDTGIPSIGAEKIEKFGVYNYNSEKYISESYFNKLKNGIVKSGDVLLYKDGAYTGKVSMALNGFPYKKCAVNEHVFIINTVENWAKYYLYFTLYSKENRYKIFTMASSKAAQPGLNQTELKSLDIRLADKAEIIKFEKRVEPIMFKIANNTLQNKTLEQLRDILLPKLMNGEIDLNNIKESIYENR